MQLSAVMVMLRKIKDISDMSLSEIYNFGNDRGWGWGKWFAGRNAGTIGEAHWVGACGAGLILGELGDPPAPVGFVELSGPTCMRFPALSDQRKDFAVSFLIRPTMRVSELRRRDAAGGGCRGVLRSGGLFSGSATKDMLFPLRNRDKQIFARKQIWAALAEASGGTLYWLRSNP
ncbi:MAG TPA: hypothetical protein VGY56_09415 [Verrucomicrobiae bacterium]|nr:hypothetical protein [Verrucomicrobiae bacterium]